MQNSPNVSDVVEIDWQGWGKRGGKRRLRISVTSLARSVAKKRRFMGRSPVRSGARISVNQKRVCLSSVLIAESRRSIQSTMIIGRPLMGNL